MSGSSIIKSNIQPVILAGVLGTRLWPLSTCRKPKPFLKLGGKYSFLQKTILRAKRFLDPVIITHIDHKALLERQLKEINCTAYKIIYEPERRNTGPAIISCALALEDDPNLMLVMPSDHQISQIEQFHNKVQLIAQYHNPDRITLFGVQPSYPNTHYGYIKLSEVINEALFNVEGFYEKPYKRLAKNYVESGQFFWNSGMVLTNPNVILDQARLYLPNDFDLMRLAYSEAEMEWAEDIIYLNRDSYVNLASTSLDYSILERSRILNIGILGCQWKDLGRFSSFLPR